MTRLTAEQVRTRLFTQIAAAAEVRYKAREAAVIPADSLRRLVLRLPLEGEDQPRKLTAFGIRIVGATIRGPLDLDNAHPADGGPVCPLEFLHCTFIGGFTGVHARFSRLCFGDCRFRDPPGRGPPGPSINLAGSSIAADLGLRRVKPASRADHFWVRAAGARIDGEVDLSCSVLKAPPERADRQLSEPARDALDLSLAELRGDFQFMNGGACNGRINMRGIHVTGDIWMSGATLRVGSGASLFLQSATIGGNLILDGRPPCADGSGGFERFTAVGELDLHDIKLGGSLEINDVELRPAPADADPLLRDGGVCVRLAGARIGGSVAIGSEREEKAGAGVVEKSRFHGRLILDGAELSSSIKLENAQIGLITNDRDVPPTISARSLVARRVEIKGVEPLPWSDRDSDRVIPSAQMLSVNLDGARVERLKVRASRFSGYLRARPLTCARDVTLDLWAGGEVDLTGSEIGGSLEISNLRVDGRLCLRDAGVGRALTFKRPRGPEGKLEQLVRVRVSKLTCLPETRLFETLWSYRAGQNRIRLCQIAFLKNRRLLRPIDRPEALDDFVATQGHSIADINAAEEYVRLAVAYAGRSDDRAYIVTAGAKPPFVEFDHSTPAAEAAPATAAAGGAAAPAPAAATAAQAAAGDPRPAAPVAAEPPLRFDSLPPEQLAVQLRREDGIFSLRGCFIRPASCVGGSDPRPDRLERVTFQLTPAPGRVIMKAVDESRIGPPLLNVPVGADAFLYHPDLESRTEAADGEIPQWVIPPLPGTGGDERRPAAYRELLLPYVQPGASIRGLVDLTDLSCDTLDDGGGRFWGKGLKFRLDRFVYRQATWAADFPDAGFTAWYRRHVSRLIAERAQPWLIERRKWKEKWLEGADFWAPWQVRRNWIYQQFDLEADLPSPTRHKIRRSEYRPQPFEQAIRVARGEGREDFVSNFEILKRRIEWSLFSEASRRPLLIIGVVSALAWLAVAGGIRWLTLAEMAALLLLVLIGTAVRPPRFPFLGWLARAVLSAAILAVPALFLWADPSGDPVAEDRAEMARTFAVAVLILVALRYMSTASDWLMRNLFGYLRLPINAIVSLVAAFLIGWAGVDLANDRRMLVIDVEPVASVVARSDDDRRVYVGTERGGPGAYKVACGDEIDEPLYALDVLIPLIDLRQEIRCEVGRALPFDESDPDERKPVAYIFERVFGRMLDSERFWSAAKALYAIAGWFLVSLSILTFANANRTRPEP